MIGEGSRGFLVHGMVDIPCVNGTDGEVGSSAWGMGAAESIACVRFIFRA